MRLALNGLELLALALIAGITVWAATPRGRGWLNQPSHHDITGTNWTPKTHRSNR